jgi:tetratricopeptide (TPR) repeat protein
LDGRILNDIGYGGWLEWQYPNQVFIDGRLEVVGEDLYKEYLSAVNEGKLPELINKYNPQLVIFDHGVTYSWIPILRDLPDWKLIYLDDVTAVYGKKDYVKDVRMNYIAEFFEAEGFSINYSDADIDRILEIEPGFKKSDWFSGFYEPHKQYLNMIDFALFAMTINRLKEAEFTYLNVLDKSNGKLEYDILKDLYFNLGTIYHRNEDKVRAMKCYAIALKLDPNNEVLKQRILSLGIEEKK